jgi:regulator of nucleoside diphosphate kinase
METRKDQAMIKRPLLISDRDRERLAALIDLAHTDVPIRDGSPSALKAELQKAKIVPTRKMPPDVVTMNSVVLLRDLDTDEIEEYELVYPPEADAEFNRISVLAPIGTAILGYRVGDAIEWPVPAGLRRLRIEEVIYQPERAGALHR